MIFLCKAGKYLIESMALIIKCHAPHTARIKITTEPGSNWPSIVVKGIPRPLKKVIIAIIPGAGVIIGAACIIVSSTARVIIGSIGMVKRAPYLFS